jgi:hypothetical protein
MKFRLILILTLAGFSLKAQVPGYLGKRFTVFLDANPFPALVAPNMNNALVFQSDTRTFVGKRNAFAFNIRPQLEIDYLVSRDFSLGLFANYILTGTTTATELTDTNGELSTAYQNGVVKGQSAGITLKFFSFRKSASIAPIGFYKSVTVGLTRANVYERMDSDKKVIEKDLLAPVLYLGIGRQSVVARNILVRTGLVIGVTGVPFDFLTSDEQAWPPSDFNRHFLHRSLFAYNVVNFSVAVGYIPF